MMKSNNPIVIDVTLRESVYTDRLISYETALNIIKKINKLSFCNYIEIGYINTKKTLIDLKKYNENYINNVKNITTKKISCMTNLNEFEDNVLVWDKDIIKQFDMVRIIIDDDISNLSKAIDYFHGIGVKVSINCTYLSRKNMNEINHLINCIISSNADIIYIADTNGSMFPNELCEIYNYIKSINSNIEIGFHGHNHFNLVVANACAMIENKIDYMDTTIGGFGKGAGNLKIEIIPFLLNKISNYDLHINDIYILYDILKDFNQEYVNNYLNLLYAYKNLKLKEIKKLQNSSNADNIIDNILEYDINE